MTYIKQILFIALASFSLLTLFSCSDPKPIDKQQVATDFIQAIYQNNAVKATQLTRSHLNIREQEWESAPDGAGFVLGKAQDVSLNTLSTIKNWFVNNINRIGVEGMKPSKVDVNLLKDEFKGIESRWQDVDIYLFLRGMGDVEHIFVVGIDAKGKVATVYFN